MTTIDFASVQWGRKTEALLEPLLERKAEDWVKLAQLIPQIAHIKQAGGTITPAQLTVLLQNLHTKNLDSLEAVKGGLMVQFSGGGFEYERYLLKEDGRIPNHKYESKRL